jgi:hypothetical protein
VSEPFQIDVSKLAASQILAAEQWWAVNRPKAPGAIRAELERAASLISLQPRIGAGATNATFISASSRPIRDMSRF